jgi:hypothetical protein
MNRQAHSIFVFGSSEISDCQQYRYRLGRMWGDGPKVCFIGLNPSTADAEKDDPTVRRWSNFARAWGYDGFYAVNLFPFRSSSPAECRRWVEGPGDNLGHTRSRLHAMESNLDRIRMVLEETDLVVACWGAGNWDPEWAEEILSRIKILGHDVSVFGLTAGGHPIHPMARGKHRVPDDAKPVLWRAKEIHGAHRHAGR